MSSQLLKETLMLLLVMALLAQCCSRSLELLKVGQNSLGAWEGQVNESVLNSWENHCNYRYHVPLPPGSALSLACATLSAQPRTLIGSCVLREQKLSLAREKGSQNWVTPLHGIQVGSELLHSAWSSLLTWLEQILGSIYFLTLT